uniref:Uncharacterized protein n=1 Tax=Ananas comosus var. bracteatus TaxID=296719 RepID=A0A6V7P3U0_ANACO|nr:unnamed protein product [Ananas comosus var. bracteatus]
MAHPSPPHRGFVYVGIVLLLGLGFGSDLAIAAGFKVPFRVKDVLPILPRQVSWPMMSTIHSAVDLLPSFVGSVGADPRGAPSRGRGPASSRTRRGSSSPRAIARMGSAGESSTSRLRQHTAGHAWIYMYLRHHTG